MPNRPTNHVTRTLDDIRRAAPAEEWPEVPEDLVAHLEAAFPPRCYDHRGESLEDHLVYGGKVDLVATLRAVFEEQREAALAGHDPDGGPAATTTIEVET